MVFELLTTIVGALVGSGGSALSKWLELKDKKENFKHEIKLLEMQKELSASETENELAIAQEASFADMRIASYEHDKSAGETSRWVNNILRLVRPVLTILLITLVWIIWLTTENSRLQSEIISNVMFMSSAALTWWFGDRARNSRKK